MWGMSYDPHSPLHSSPSSDGSEPVTCVLVSAVFVPGQVLTVPGG